MKEKTDTASKIDALKAKIKEQEELRQELLTIELLTIQDEQ